ncbi:MAG: LysR family transcriptional regulator [Alphaproteobacteria bacterium]|nr:LysR family transcriptional regulator [Alphaproteobacteria bacterium]
MNVRDFEYLIAVDELKSFSKASQECSVSQPALSQQIKKIEGQLGFNIFERDKKNIITTAKGKAVIKQAKSIINSYLKIKNINNNEVSIKIALIPTICPYLLPLIVDKLHQKLPNIKFYFLELKTDDLIKRLKAGEIDFGIIAYFQDLIDDKLNYLKLYDEEFLLTLPKQSKLTQDDFLKIMEEKKLILLEEGNCLSDNIKEICSIYNQNSFSNFYATNIETVKNMVRINNGAALLPKLSCLDNDNLKTLSFTPKKFREVGIINRKSFDQKDLVGAIRELIVDSLDSE